MRLNVRKQCIKFCTLPGVAGRAFGNAPMLACLLVVCAVQRKVINRRKAGLVGPGFEHMGLAQSPLQPRWRIVAKTREQHQVRAARHNVDGVDLQQLHALDATAKRQRRGCPGGRRQQALRSELEVARLL